MDRQRPRGFALVVTLSLMILLTILAVGLLSLATVSLRASGQSRDMETARANARLAMMLALGELQKQTGPDQRATGVADLATNAVAPTGGGTTAGTVTAANLTTVLVNPPSTVAPPLTVANGISDVHDGTRYWTGVWGNYGGYTAAAPNDIYQQVPAPVLLNWLVSGNESTSAAVVTPANGLITSPSATPGFTPANAIGGLSATSTARSSTLTIGTLKAALLVGAGTLTGGAAPSAADLGKYVAAPLVTIKGADGKVSGRYAYWVGDEGIKAKSNIVDKNAASTSGTPESKSRLMTPPRSGVEILPDWSASNYLAQSQATGTSKPLERVITQAQTRLLDPTNLTAQAVAKNFHNLTTYASGLQTDNFRGGLKRDLSNDFAQATLPTWTAPGGLAAGTGTSILPAAYSPKSLGAADPAALPAGTANLPLATAVTGNTAATSTYGSAAVGTCAPRWDLLYDYYNHYAKYQSGGAVPAQAATLNQMGIAPQIVQLRVMMGVDATAGQKINALFTPLVVLGNPYSMPLKVTGMTVKFMMTRPPDASDLGVNRKIAYSKGSGGGSNEGDRYMRLLPYENDPASGDGKDAFNRNLAFALPAATIPPGETRIFSLTSRTTLASNTATATVNLSVGSAADFAVGYNYVARPSTWNSDTYTAPPTAASAIYYKFNESDANSPMVMLIQDATGQTVQRLGGLNLDAWTGQFGTYMSQYGATSPAGTATGRIIAAFNFDLTDPGTGEKSVRPYVDLNLRAANIRLSKETLMAGSFGRDSAYTGSINTANGTTPSYPPVDFTSNLDPSPQWGYHGGTTKPVFHDLPQEPLFSLGALQHANVTTDDVALNTGTQPDHAIGNSYAPVFLPRALVKSLLTDTYQGNASPPKTSTSNYYDLSYLLNAALWDGYFFSTIPQSGAANTPVNRRYTLNSGTTTADARNAQKAAAQLAVDGAFNVNSTSIEAWAAVLGGMRNLPALPGVAGSNANASIFPRSLRQTADAKPIPTGTGNDSYSGFRRLSDAQVNALAGEIVKQVRLRGPFVALAQFVNRAPNASANDPAGLGFCGALQSAIDRTTINDFSAVTTANDKLDCSTTRPLTTAFGSYFYDADFATNAPRVPQRSAGIPGWLTQADVLQAIAPVISTRSDTFVIRTCGQALAKDGVTVTAAAWCEAVVQRTPEYVDASDGAWVHPAAATSLNRQFGRRYKILSLRWCSPDEI